MKPTVLLLALLMGCSASNARAQQNRPAANPLAPAPASAPASQAASTPDPAVDAILDALDRRGDSLKDFTADVRLQEVDEGTGTSSVRTGRVWFAKLPSDDARMRLTLDKKEVRGKTIDDKLEYVFSGGWLIDRDYARKINKRRQVVRPGDKINLLKLGEGPFPLPLGQDKADVYKMFDVKKSAQAKNDPQGSVHLHLIPKPGTRFAKKVDAVDFWVDPKSEMPVRVQTLEGDSTRTWDLQNISVNSNLIDKDFELSPVNEKEWQLAEEPFDER